MIEAREFVEAARARGFGWYAGVPCSYLTPFINYVLQDRRLRYLSMANEGDAVALIAGVALGGAADVVRGGPAYIPGPRAGAADRVAHGRGIAMMQNSGLGNAVSPLTSLTWTFRLPQLLIVTWRGEPGVPDEPQHALMGPITPSLLHTMEIAWEPFPTQPAELEPALERALAHMEGSGRPYALLMRQGSVAPYALRGDPAPAARAPAVRTSNLHGGQRPSRREALQAVIAATPGNSTAVLASTGYCGRELYALADRPNQFYMVGSMGCVAPLALGLALARPDLRVVALDGDGAALMRMGAFATVGAYGAANLRHLLLDNGAHESTGGQATVSAGVDFCAVAAACGYAATLDTDAAADLGAWLQAAPDGPGFARIRIRPGTPPDLPRPKLAPVDVKLRLMRHFGPPA